MDRQQSFEAARNAVVARLEDFYDPDDPYPGEAEKLQAAKEATNLSQLAEVCQNNAWGWDTFVKVILSVFGFSIDEGDFDREWINAHAYGWDT